MDSPTHQERGKMGFFDVLEDERKATMMKAPWWTWLPRLLGWECIWVTDKELRFYRMGS